MTTKDSQRKQPQATHPVLPNDPTISQCVRFVSGLLVEMADTVDSTIGLELEARQERVGALIDSWFERYDQNALLEALSGYADGMKPFALAIAAHALEAEIEKDSVSKNAAADLVAAALG